MQKVFSVSVLALSCLYAHPGRTNSEGCHNQRGGTYHCHGKKAKKSAPKKTINNASTDSGQYSCERKYCKYMTSCDEAYYQMNVCGHAGLDRDHDGIPCENICH
ncbi:MAG: excalibur calcium-binding domain-containing protein [Sulfurimonas sp.]|uniref:excalibur calcium-binding domain-containing protein n=1 Tax=Sulfurimonas sp. TaxID=2022749 RepID=UPI00261F4B5C|nr:excalibur calcium-binding domain-containing protein [Sulfurimonas sp.]MDD2653032.1 excalibur calcium-binding domain-containing protein [Sulfurimonas sp.]MDD3452275.1 excalibur calcium-binding domain-containing protein [Sulfurimonas sp.]